jgi:hypothetical protein
MTKLFNTLLFNCLVAIAIPANAQTMKIAAGTQLKNQGTIILQNVDIRNDGIITNPSASSLFIFKGNSDNSVSGTGTTSFYHLTMAKSGMAKTIFNKSTKVAGNLTMGGGYIDLANSMMELMPSAVIQNETENSRITAFGTGEIFITLPVSNPSNFNPANIGVALTSTQNLGLTTFRRGHQPQSNGIGSESIMRYYKITPANNTGLNANLRFFYFDGELNSAAESSLRLFAKGLNGNWSMLGTDAADVGLNFVQKNGLATVNTFSLFNIAHSLLPVTLRDFNATCNQALAELKWSTTDEVNAKQFVIEKSSNGRDWQARERVAAKGGTKPNHYSLTLPSDATSYYRLKIEDNDGRFAYSATRTVSCGGKTEISHGPNPTTGIFTIAFNLPGRERFTIRLQSADGALLINRSITVNHIQIETFDISHLASGIYFLTLTNSESENKIFTLVKH